MQDEKRRNKFSLIERFETGMERVASSIMEQANIIDDRIEQRRVEREKRAIERQNRRRERNTRRQEKRK